MTQFELGKACEVWMELHTVPPCHYDDICVIQSGGVYKH